MFKEYIKQDIDRVFMNEKEFSEIVKINGVSVVVNIDNDRLSQKEVFAIDGVVTGDILFFITHDEFKKVPNVKKTPKVNDAIMFNNRPCIVSSVYDDAGIYEIVLKY